MPRKARVEISRTPKESYVGGIVDHTKAKRMLAVHIINKIMKEQIRPLYSELFK